MKKRATRQARAAFQPIALAAAVLLGSSLPAQAQYYDYEGSVFTWPTDLIPSIDAFDPVLDLRPNSLTVGAGATGSFSVWAGADMQAWAIYLGHNGTGNGSMVVQGQTEGTPISALVRLGGTDNRLGIGEWGTGTLTVSGGAIVDATVDTAGCGAASCRSFVGNGAGSTGTLTVTGAGSEVRTLRSFTVGQTTVVTDPPSGFNFGTPGGTTNAFVNVLDGGTLRTEGATVANNNRSPNGNGSELANGTVVVNGAGSQWIVSRNSVDNSAALMGIGIGSGANGLVTVSGGGKLHIDGTGSSGPNDGINIGSSGKGKLVVTGTGSQLLTGGVNHFINVGANNSLGDGSFEILAGATASTLYLNVGRNGGTGTILIDGAGSTLTQSGVGVNQAPGANGAAFASIGRNLGPGGGNGSVTVSDGGQWIINDGGGDGRVGEGSPGIGIGRGANSIGTLTITGAGSVVSITSSTLNPGTGIGDNYNPFVGVGYDNPSTSTGTLTVSAGGKLLLTGNAASTAANPRATHLAIGGRGDGLAANGIATITGANSEIRVQGSDALISVGRGPGGNGTLDVLDGGKLTGTLMLVGTYTTGTVNIDDALIELSGQFNTPTVGATLAVGRGAGGDGVLNMSNGAAISITPQTLSGLLTVGGDSIAQGGMGTVTLSGGSLITFGGTVSGNNVNIGRNGTGTLSLAGNSSVDVGATGTADFGRLASGVGSLDLKTGSIFSANVIDFGGNSDAVAGGVGTGSVSGLGSEIKASGAGGFLSVGRNGTGMLTITEQGKASAIVLSVGRYAGSGTLVADNATIALAGQQTGGLVTGAVLAVGTGGGNGSATLIDSTLSLTNAGSSGAGITIGGSGNFPGGTGMLTAVNTQITIDAAPGLGNVHVGRNGSGTAMLDASTLTNTGGNVYVGREVGSVGTLALTNGSTLTAEFVGVGVSAAGTGAAIGAPGGVGTLALDGNSTVYTGRFELGANSFLVGNGTIDAEGDVVIAGTVSPGYSPGRIRIRCNIVVLPGGRIVLEISGSGDDFAGYAIDQLIIGEAASFDLGSADIVFSFLGDTNPNVVSALGGLNLDYYLRAGSEDLDAPLDAPTLALSNLFQPGQGWSDVIDPTKVSAVSERYDVTSFSYTGGGTFELTAVPVPEPSTWGLMFAGLAAVGGWARRRKAQAAQA